MKTHPNHILLLCVTPVFLWSAWEPYDRLTWWLEVAPVIFGFIAIYWAQLRRAWSLSNFALTMIGLHMVILIVGGHYTYARVPAGDWFAELFNLKRNHYDRLGHLAQGLVPAIICREMFIRLKVVSKRGWRSFIIVSVCLAISATYELIEYATALVSIEAAESFLGTQGDQWDTQNDMFLALIGAITAVTILRWPHNLSMRRHSKAESQNS